MSSPAAAPKGFDKAYTVMLIAVFLTGTASAGLLVIKPLLVGALIQEYLFTPPQAGFVAGIEMAGIGIAAFVVAALGGGWPRRRVIISGATLGILGSIVPMLTDAYWPILVARFVAGTGCGLIASIVLAVIGTTRDPDRTFGLYYILTYVNSAMMVPVGLWVLSRYGVPGGYAFLALVLAIAYITVHRVPERVGTQTRHADGTGLPPFPMTDGLLALGLSLLFWIGVGGIWAFVERLGTSAGLTPQGIGFVLTIGPLFSIAGALTASILHIRFGRFPILTIAISLAAVGATLLGPIQTSWTFAAGVLTISYVWSLFLAYMGGAMSAIDPSGRVIALSVTSQTIGMAVGPATAGLIASKIGYEGIALMGLACFIATLPLLMLLRMRQRPAVVHAQ